MDATTPPNSVQRAAGSSFYAAMRILPRAQREAMYEIYSFCRRVDDIADSNGPRPERLAQLGEWRRQVTALYQGRQEPLMAGLAQAVRAFDLAQEDFLAVIDGMEMDAAGDIRAPSWATLDLYCDRVASAVGRLSVRVFGMNREDGRLLAHHLGRALQLTNILRDLDEDADAGRLYLPHEALLAAGIETNDPVMVLRNPALAATCSQIVERARTHFFEADAVMARSSRRTVRAPRIMDKVYRSILEGMVARGWQAPRERVRISRVRLGWILLLYSII